METKKVNEILSKFFKKENDFFIFNKMKFIYINGYLNVSGCTEFDLNRIKTRYQVIFSYEIKSENDLYFIINYWLKMNELKENFKPM